MEINSNDYPVKQLLGYLKSNDGCSFIWATHLRKKPFTLFCFVGFCLFFRVKELDLKFFMDCAAVEEGCEMFLLEKS